MLRKIKRRNTAVKKILDSDFDEIASDLLSKNIPNNDASMAMMAEFAEMAKDFDGHDQWCMCKRTFS